MLLTRFMPFAALSMHKPRQSASRTSIAGQAYVRWTPPSGVARRFSKTEKIMSLIIKRLFYK
jgi:hypothetical protein